MLKGCHGERPLQVQLHQDGWLCSGEPKSERRNQTAQGGVDSKQNCFKFMEKKKPFINDETVLLVN